MRTIGLPTGLLWSGLIYWGGLISENAGLVLFRNRLYCEVVFIWRWPPSDDFFWNRKKFSAWEQFEASLTSTGTVSPADCHRLQINGLHEEYMEIGYAWIYNLMQALESKLNWHHYGDPFSIHNESNWFNVGRWLPINQPMRFLSD